MNTPPWLHVIVVTKENIPEILKLTNDYNYEELMFMIENGRAVGVLPVVSIIDIQLYNARWN